jgi:hypothetical protein
VLRFLLWRILGLTAALAGAALLAWFIGGGPGRLLRGAHSARLPSVAPERLAGTVAHLLREGWRWTPAAGLAPARLTAELSLLVLTGLALSRAWARRRRRYVRLRVEPYRGDHTTPTASSTTGRTTST